MSSVGNVVVLLSCFLAGTSALQKLTELFSWSSLDYTFASDEHKSYALERGEFVPENNLPVGIEVWKNKLFVTVPRWANGVPSTLNYIPLDVSSTPSPKLTPYPNWAYNREGNCDGLTTTYRVKADTCNRLWVLDSGTVGIGNTTKQVCPYAIHVFDLTTDKVLRKYTLRPEDTNDRTFIANIAIDIGSKGCEDTFLYASDELGYGLISYSWELNTSWRHTHSFLMPDPLAGDFNIGGLNFQWGEEGVFGITVSPFLEDGFRLLFFHPLASNREFAVSTKFLRDPKITSEEIYHDFVVLESRGPGGHITAHYMNDDGILFFNLIDRNAVGCWNSKVPYEPKSLDIIDWDDTALIFPSDVKVDSLSNLWVMSDRMPNHLIDKLDFTDINFRIFYAPLDKALAGTVCANSIPYAPYLSNQIAPKPY
ncbi:protein yellow [Adelges cooleyi]|uniref:protein yellow n=1 Tax=Adelges cooleyi TaxID=133065 RepID=UPI00217F9EB5|nr:protein yellow [Adelges cooleyi]